MMGCPATLVTRENTSILLDLRVLSALYVQQASTKQSRGPSLATYAKLESTLTP
jgi:hypothetical protein